MAGDCLATYITSGIRLAWMMVTRIPPMIAAKPTTHEARRTILQDCGEFEVASQDIISLRPILFFSYEGQVAVEGIVTTRSSSLQRKGSVDSASGD